MLHNYVVISDVHLFHRRTPTQHIVDALWLWIAEHEAKIKKCKFFVIAGDIFDRFIPSHYPDISIANRFFYKFGAWLASNTISLIVLEGTDTHDRKQFASIMPVLAGTKVDVRYYDTVCVDVLDGMSVLFIPDNWNRDVNVTVADAKLALTNKGLRRADIAVMHGSFEYQLPMLKHGNFPQAELEDLVEHCIHIGHVHKPSHSNKVHAQGSFDRLAHGEEHSKGGDAFINNKKYRLVNKYAYPYITLPITATDPLKFKEQIKHTVEAMNCIGWLRIYADRTHPVFEHFGEIMSMFPGVRFERQYVVKDIQHSQTQALPSVIQLTTDTIFSIIKDHYPSAHPNTLELIRSLI